MHHPELPPLTTILWQLAAVFALVIANGFFVAVEFAMVSVRRTRIDQLAAEGNSSAITVQRALKELNRHIAAAQVGITVVSLLLGSTGEKVLEPLLLAGFAWMPEHFLGLTRATLALVFAYLIMTSMHVIIGEQLPKTAAIQKADTAALLIVRPMTWITWICTPLVWILNVSVNFLLVRLGLHAGEGHEQQVHSPEELDLLFTQAHEGGQLTTTERDILHRVVKFSDLTAREVMVPRVEVEGIPVEMPRRDLTALIHGQPHTRMPVYHGSLDDVVGIAHLKDLVRFEVELDQPALNVSAPTNSVADSAAQPVGANGGRHSIAPPHSPANPAKEHTVNLMSVVREVPRVPETITIDRMLLTFKKRRQQMAIVIDEYGGTAGIITMGDLLDQIFGDVHDEFDQPEPEILPRADGRVQIAGSVRIDEINERFSTGFRSDQADTMAGLVLDELGRPAVVGDEVEINGVSLRVETVERLRITTLSLLLPSASES
jgi:CBS domain containing-hemolysin-like protein